MNARRHFTTFLSGLVVSLPIIVTLAVFAWLVGAAEAVMGGAVKLLLPEGSYVPGIGLVIGILLIYGIGLATRLIVFRSVVNALEQQLNRIPVVKTLYGSIRDLIGMFSGNGGASQFSRMVIVDIPGVPLRPIGFITLESFEHLDIDAADGDVAVYMPMSYQIGGYMALINRQYLKPVDMKLEEGMRFVVTAGMSGPQNDGGQEDPGKAEQDRA